MRTNRFNSRQKIMIMQLGIFLTIILGSNQLCWASQSDRSWLSVPIYFATTRAREPKRNAYTGGRNIDKTFQSVSYGKINVSVEVDNQMIDKSAMVKLGWKKVTAKEKKTVQIEHLARDEFFKEVQMRH